MEEIDKILYKLGYYDADPLKKQEVKDYIDESVEFMKSAGVPEKQLTSSTAYVVKTIWADARDAGKEDTLVKKDGMIVALISQMRRSK